MFIQLRGKPSNHAETETDFFVKHLSRINKPPPATKHLSRWITWSFVCLKEEDQVSSRFLPLIVDWMGPFQHSPSNTKCWHRSAFSCWVYLLCLCAFATSCIGDSFIFYYFKGGERKTQPTKSPELQRDWHWMCFPAVKGELDERIDTPLTSVC